MKKLLSATLASLMSLSLITGCATQQPLNLDPGIVANTNNTAVSAIDNKYIITAQALLDKVVKTPKPEDREKIKKDFERELKTLNRYAIQGLLKYGVKVLQDNLPAGHDIKESPALPLLYSLLNRLMDIYTNLFDSVHQIFDIALEEDQQKIEAEIAAFEKSIKKLGKADLKSLVNFVNGQSSNLPDFLPVGSPLYNRIMKIIQDRITAVS